MGKVRWNSRGTGLLVLAVFFPLMGAEGTVFVSKEGDDSDGTSWETAFSTINKALIEAETGESIWIAKGSYYEGFRIEKPVQLYGGFSGIEDSLETPGRNPAVNKTYIAGGSQNVIVRIFAACQMDGLTIRKGANVNAIGCGITRCSVTIRDCTFESNYGIDPGGGLNIGNSTVHLERCVIQNNSALGGGGGIYSSDSTLIISNCRITDNEARDANTVMGHFDSDAGGIVFSGTLDVVNSVIANNRATKFSQIDGSGPGELLFQNCSFYSKSHEFIRVDPRGGDVGVFRNCIFWGHRQVFPAGHPVDVVYSNSSQSIEGPGNISEDPLFVDAEGGDFRLMPNSPCIDSGTDVGVYFDITGSTRPLDVKGRGQDDTGSEFDMGAYELQIPKADLNKDGKIDGRDLLEFQREWRNEAPGK